MNTTEIRATIFESIAQVAPEIDPELLDPAVTFRDQIDIDSMDFLNIVIGVHQRLGIDIPEADYPKLATLDGFIAYLTGKAGEKAA